MRNRGSPTIFWTIDDQMYINDVPWMAQELEREMEHLTQFINSTLTVMVF